MNKIDSFEQNILWRIFGTTHTQGS